ncbi:MAG: TfoX/Sxy family protein [Lysobacter sp.]|nr:TfoX/Sxy family protein [Lysobacter sp.]
MPTEDMAHLRELLAGFGDVAMRPMFGGHGVYREGMIFAIVMEGDLYLTVDADSRARFEAAGCAPFVYSMKGRPLPLSYWSVPAEALEAADAMLPWAELAWAAALRKQAARRRGRRRR